MNGEPQLPNRLQLIAETIAEHLFDLKLALGVIADLDMTFAAQGKFHVESLELLRAIESYLRHQMRAANLLGEGITEFQLDNGNIVYSFTFGDDPKGSGKGTSHVLVTYVHFAGTYPKG
jgi:hypothetical protein